MEATDSVPLLLSKTRHRYIQSLWALFAYFICKMVIRNRTSFESPSHLKDGFNLYENHPTFWPVSSTYNPQKEFSGQTRWLIASRHLLPSSRDLSLIPGTHVAEREPTPSSWVLISDASFHIWVATHVHPHIQEYVHTHTHTKHKTIINFFFENFAISGLGKRTTVSSRPAWATE